MIPEYSATVMTTRKTLALLLSFFVCTYRVFAEDPNAFYSEEPMSNTAPAQSHSVLASAARLSDILTLKESLSDLLSQSSEADITEPVNRERSEQHEISDKREPSGQHEISKRIFCNGFTGCGARYRDRRRLTEPDVQLSKRSSVFTKRPFCNTYGCYNNGRKRFSPTPSDTKNGTPQDTGSKFVSLDDGWSGLKKARIFCNPGTGCQNPGKRSAMFKTDVAKKASIGHRLSPPESKGTSTPTRATKRFYTSDFDEEMENLIGRMKRCKRSHFTHNHINVVKSKLNPAIVPLNNNKNKFVSVSGGVPQADLWEVAMIKR